MFRRRNTTNSFLFPTFWWFFWGPYNWAISQLLEDFPDMDEDSVSLIRSNILKIARDEKAVKIKRRRITFMFYAAAVFVGVVAMTYVFKESAVQS